MKLSETSLNTNTPSVMACDARGLSVREVQYHRHPDSLAITQARITCHQFDARGINVRSADPRLNEAGLANFIHITSLSGTVLCQEGVDNGTVVTLNDAAGRSFRVVSNIRSGDDGADINRHALTRIFQYESNNLRGRPVSLVEQNAEGVRRISERWRYAGNSDLEASQNLAGQCVSHYDSAGLVRVDSLALSGVALSVTRRLLANAENPDAVADWQGEDAQAWDALLAAKGFTHQTTTDATGAEQTTTDAAGNRQRMAYDVAGRLTSRWLTLKNRLEKNIVKSLTYSAAGQTLREEHANGVVTRWGYEVETQRLLGINVQRPVGHVSGAKVLQDLKYQYDPVGNVLGVHNDAEETRFWRNQEVVPQNTYVYDSLYQLVSATGREMANAGRQRGFPVVSSYDNATFTTYTRTYSYDKAGNLTRIRHCAPASNHCHTTTVTVSHRSNRGVTSLLCTDPREVDGWFTAGGQQTILQPGQPLAWTSRNEILKVTPVERGGAKDDVESYRYDGGSQRLLKITTQNTISATREQQVIYLPALELRTMKINGTEVQRLQVISVGASGQSSVRVLHWEGEAPKGIGNDQFRYSHDDLIGSSGLEVDAQGKVISREEYFPYGGTAVWTARNTAEASLKTVRYSGKERDATGLYYYGWRYYLPCIGRWLSADPAGAIDGMNLYVMAGNNPVTFRDSNGLSIQGQEARRRVGESFVHPRHMPVFERISRVQNIALSVRESGSHTINALGEGAAAKGHDILEKTIKRSSLTGVYGELAVAMLQRAESSGFAGRVGKWNKAGLQGVYARNNVSFEDTTYDINLQSPVEHELVDSWIKFKIVTPYTGDYDMHDIIRFSGGKGHVPESGSVDETEVKDLINLGVAASDPARSFEDVSMNVVRHGPQVNFVSYMWKNEFEKVQADNGYLGAVARPGPFPIAMVHQGRWSILENSHELFEFYGATNTVVPEHWAQKFVGRGGAMVATPRHAKILDKFRRANTV
jgi:insecticidal toxin complex protein TccC